MKDVDLYVRVSTDEQADKGFSLRHQEEMLRKYCAHHKLNIQKVIIEDFSAKTFNRPEWNRYLSDIKKEKRTSDAVLFLKWDRFSRNIAEAYGMIALLNKLGIEPQAIEQPLDMSVPENKIILAVYLASPEVENDRRALNVKSGQRRALKEGRFMHMAPVGYCNKTTENGRKYICPQYPEAEILQWVFNLIAEVAPPVEQALKMARQKGLKCSKTNFWWMLRNPVYYGKIVVPRFKDEPATLVQGQHEAIISEQLFHEVQDVLNGKKKKNRMKLLEDEMFPLRGFLLCPECGRTLTGSASKGRSAYYHYYHCYNPCGYRTKAAEINLAFEHEMEKYVPKPALIGLFKELVLEAQSAARTTRSQDQQSVNKAIKAQKEKIKKARDLLLTDAIDADDYKIIKEDCETEIRRLEKQITAKEPESGLKSLLDKACNTLSNLSLLYSEGAVSIKRQIIGSMFPEKMVFQKNECRTARVNEVVKLIFNVGKAFSEIKKGQTDKNFSLSQVVIPLGTLFIGKSRFLA